jgi:hypothetical protein
MLSMGKWRIGKKGLDQRSTWSPTKALLQKKVMGAGALDLGGAPERETHRREPKRLSCGTRCEAWIPCAGAAITGDLIVFGAFRTTMGSLRNDLKFVGR